MTRQDTARSRLSPTRRMVPLLEKAQQPGLHVRGDVADLVQEQGPAVRLLDEALLVLDRVGEGPLDVAEQLALQQGGLGGAAVHDDEGAARARRLVVQDARRHFLARAGLAEKQHRGGGPGHPRQQLQEAGHGRGLAADQAVGGGGSAGRLRGGVPFGGSGCAGLLQPGAHPADQLLAVERLGQVVHGPCLHGVHRVRDGPVGREHDHRDVSPVFGHLPEQRLSAHAGHLHVRDDQVHGFARQHLQGGLGAVRQKRAQPRRKQPRLQHLEDVFVVVHHEDGRDVRFAHA